MKPVISLDGGIRVFGTTGDMDAFEYGGGVIYKDRNNDGFWQFWDQRDNGQKNYDVYTTPIPKTILNGFEGIDILLISSSSGLSESEIRYLSRSNDIKERTTLLDAIRNTYGPSQLDPNKDAEVVTPWELAKRWGDVFGKVHQKISPIELDDYIIRESVDGGYECGRVDGTYLGKYDKNEHAMSAISGYMESHDGFAYNVFFEHSDLHLEVIEWDPSEHVYSYRPKLKRNYSYVSWKNSMRKYVKEKDSANKASKSVKYNRTIMKTRIAASIRSSGVERLESAKRIRKSMEDMLGND